MAAQNERKMFSCFRTKISCDEICLLCSVIIVIFTLFPFLQYCSEITVKACQTYIRDVKQSGVDAIVDVSAHF